MGKGNNIQTPSFRASRLRSFCLIAFLLCQSLQSIVSLPTISPAEVSALKTRVRARLDQFCREQGYRPEDSQFFAIVREEYAQIKPQFGHAQYAPAHSRDSAPSHQAEQNYGTGVFPSRVTPGIEDWEKKMHDQDWEHYERAIVEFMNDKGAWLPDIDEVHGIPPPEPYIFSSQKN
uniref:AvrL2-D n=1 Tax=Melampsora lini TaxID=5261 RepID=A0A1B2CW19_MELLI|nr:AvrL2-D [Melampsora lini]